MKDRHRIKEIRDLIDAGKSINEITDLLGYKTTRSILKTLDKFGIDYEVIKTVRIHKDSKENAVYKAISNLKNITILNIHNLVYKVYPEYNLDVETIKNILKEFNMRYEIKGARGEYYVILAKDRKEVKQLTRYAFEDKSILLEVVKEMNKLPIENGIFNEEEIVRMYKDKESK
jgi:hypothetical protein